MAAHRYLALNSSRCSFKPKRNANFPETFGTCHLLLDGSSARLLIFGHDSFSELQESHVPRPDSSPVRRHGSDWPLTSCACAVLKKTSTPECLRPRHKHPPILTSAVILGLMCE